METNVTYNPAQLSAKSQALIEKNNANEADINASAMKAAKEFEAVFLTTMLENMFTGIETSEPFGGGHAEKTFRSLQIAEYAKDMSYKGGIGIADHVYREILAAQEGRSR